VPRLNPTRETRLKFVEIRADVNRGTSHGDLSGIDLLVKEAQSSRHLVATLDLHKPPMSQRTRKWPIQHDTSSGRAT
jgi:hypothetical protein